MGTATEVVGWVKPMKDKTIIWLAAGGIVFWLIALKPAILESAFHDINKLVDAILRHF